MKVIADLEVHSKYARAVSSQMTIPIIAEWAGKKGIDLVGTGDFTHPMWLRELEANLEEAGTGVYRLRKHLTPNTQHETLFLLTSEVSCIYSHKGKGRRVHIMVYLPSFDKVKKFNQELTARGVNLFSDGRPIIGLTLAQVLEIALSVEPNAIVIPAHVWTPWFGFYGHMSGYDSLKEAFGDLEKYILAVETGLSSDPAMNWRIEELEGKTIVSFGDAHSPPKLGREATVFELPKVSYENVRQAIQQSNNETIKQSKIAYTIEFYPEEGKYHYTGHRNCKVIYSPNETRKMGTICPVCGRRLTVGVMNRVEHLGKVDVETQAKVDDFGVRFIYDLEEKKKPYVMLVPLLEILAEAIHSGVANQKVLNVYEHLVNTFESEFKVLLGTPIEGIEKEAGSRVAEAISKVRSGDIVIEPGYDGVFGKVKIWKESETKEINQQANQTTLF